MRRFLLLLLLAVPAAAGGALASRPSWSSLEPGRWLISRNAVGTPAVAMCVRDFAALAQWQERGRSCQRTILSHSGSDTVIRYTCGGGDFGQATVTAVTGRSLTIDTQGIHRGEPFHDRLFARKSGTCANH